MAEKHDHSGRSRYTCVPDPPMGAGSTGNGKQQQTWRQGARPAQPYSRLLFRIENGLLFYMTEAQAPFPHGYEKFQFKEVSAAFWSRKLLQPQHGGIDALRNVRHLRNQLLR